MSKNIRYEMCRAIELQYRPGTSKRAAERNNSGKSKSIHSRDTKLTYIQHAKQYGNFLRDRGLNHATMEQAREHAPEYIRSQKSEWSKTTARSALARVFGCDGRDICAIDKRNPKNIVRGREMTDRAAAIERNHPDVCAAGRACGARHFREFERIEAGDLHWRGDELYVHIVGKGGRERDAIVLPGKGRDIILKAAAERPAGALFKGQIPSGINCHKLRADYAAACYRYAEKHGGYSNNEEYNPRDDSGESFNKGILNWVSEQIGHGSERYYTIYYNYLSYGR